MEPSSGVDLPSGLQLPAGTARLGFFSVFYIAFFLHVRWGTCMLMLSKPLEFRASLFSILFVVGFFGVRLGCDFFYSCKKDPFLPNI